MEFFGMGMGEILLVVIVALIIFGPGKMPEVARTVGKALNALKQTSSDLTTQIRKELEEEETRTRNHSPHPEVNTRPETTAPLSVDKPEANKAGKTDSINI